MPKRNCTGRAAWRLQTGKPAAAISSHYRLDCDFGTPVVVCWKQGGTEPIYVCESHAQELGPSREHGPEARILTADLEKKDNPIQREDRKQTQIKVRIQAKTQPETKTETEIQTQTQAEAQTQTQNRESAGVKSNGAAPLKAESKVAEKKIRRTVNRTASEAPTKSRARDVTFGDSAKAMVDEAIWNLATGDYEVYRTAIQAGKSADEAAQAAGGQLAVIQQKINEYALKLDAALAESKATIGVGEAIDKPLEQAVLEIISHGAMSDAEKDAAMQELGAIQEWVKHDRVGDLTPLQANQITMAIGERLNWGGNSDVSEERKPVYRMLYGNLKTALRAAVPEALTFHNRLTNLYAAKSDLDRELLPSKELTQTLR